MMGKLWGVGIGPGDAELLTLKAVRLIEECEVLAVPQTKGEKSVALDIVSKAVNIKNKEILYLDFLMVKDKKLLEKAHNENGEKICQRLRQGQMVAFITLGDVSVYSTFSYVQKNVVEKGFEVEICPGVPSFCAVAAKAKVSLTQMKKPLHIIPATHLNAEEYLHLEGTKVFMKAGRDIDEIRKAITDDVFAFGVSNCCMENEVVFNPKTQSGTGYFTTVIVKEKE